MSVVGLGTDIIEISRVAKQSEAMREKLANRVLTSVELARYQQLNQNQAIAYLAKRWAAKEAAAKALGTGIADGVSFQHFDIQTLASGQPKLVLSERALALAQQLGARCWHISIADEQHYAIATVILSA